MKNIISRLHISILCIFGVLLSGCETDEIVNVTTNPTLGIVNPCVIWGATQDKVNQYMKNFDNVHNDNNTLIFNGDDKVELISYAFNNGGLSATAMFVDATNFSLANLSTLFDGYENITPFNGSYVGYLHKTLNTYGEISVVSKGDKTYYCIGWSVYNPSTTPDNSDTPNDPDNPNDTGQNNVIKYMTSNLRAVNIKSMEGWGANFISNNYDSSTNVGTITFDGPITNIPAAAFKECANLVSIQLPQTIKKIGREAFYSCEELSSITIPRSVVEIGEDAFYSCSSLLGLYIPDLSAWCNIAFGDANANPGSYCDEVFVNGELLTNLVIPSDITEIKQYAFSDWPITSVTIPDNVTTIGHSAFNTFFSNQTITNLYIHSLSAWCNIAFGDNGANPGCRCDDIFVDGELITDLVIPSDITEIKQYTFNGWPITSVTIPDNVTTIGDYAFSSCIDLTSLTIPNSVTSIGTSAFDGCSRLTNLTIPNSVTSIGTSAFDECTRLTNLTIGESVTTIGDYAFSYCTSLTSVTIPNSVTTIGDSAFSYCIRLTSLTIGDSVTTIGNNAFNSCDELTDITIPDSVITIGSGAFNNCEGLTEVFIGNCVTTIGVNAFYNCDALKKVYCKPTTPPSIDFETFRYEFTTKYRIYVPTESVNLYKSAETWVYYSDYIYGYDF